MSMVMQVRESETGLVRLFAIDLPEAQALELKRHPDALPPLLGVAALADDQWEIFAVSDLVGLGLESYLAEGHGIAPADLAPHRWTLDALEGVVLLLRSAALPDKPATLTPRAPLRWIATFGEEKAPVPIGGAVASASAAGSLAAPPTDTAAARGSLVVLGIGLVVTAAIALTFYLITRGPN